MLLCLLRTHNLFYISQLFIIQHCLYYIFFIQSFSEENSCSLLFAEVYYVLSVLCALIIKFKMIYFSFFFFFTVSLPGWLKRSTSNFLFVSFSINFLSHTKAAAV